MFTSHLLSRRSLTHLVLTMAASTLCATGYAADHAAAPPAPAAAPADAHATTKPVPAAAEPKSGAVEPKTTTKADANGAAKTTPGQESLEQLREKLAAKLGAAKAAKAASANDLRVVTNASPSALRESPPATPVAGVAPVVKRPAPLARAKAAVPPKTVVHSSKDANHAAHWSYETGSGPEVWGNMKPEFNKCLTGTRQSPIDIRDGIKVSLDAVQFDYKPSGFRVIDNGHTIQVNVSQGSSIEVMGRRYDLMQFHFHRPSEERINGKQFDMVVHLVHKDMDGRLAVVAVLLERGGAHALVQSVWNNLPLEKGEEVPAKSTLDLNAMLPAERSYFTYMGSLTTPPCSEGVLWMVLKNPVPISTEQIGIFARLYPMNARPIQSASGRLIKESN